MKENKRGKLNKLDKTTREDQPTKLKVVHDGRFKYKFYTENSNPSLLYLHNTYLLWIQIVTKANYFSNLYVECENENEIPLDLRQEQGSPPRKNKSTSVLN